ncbi:zinc finger protein 469 [Meleagris gallopavo]|uniref:zinc finger protein 469 n=1 Tax=Meleagris gallopavo TaxID=9103 RepID=UPI000549A4FB|nr:zinc finger protein 469 [Meleagris gallopavo]
MTGETQHAYNISEKNEAGPKEQDKDFGFEGCGEKDGRGLGGTEGTSSFTSTKDKEPHSQREAVIRPQQAGKIDFRSLHNNPKFAGESGWGGIKGGSQSPPGKGRTRERSRRAGKGERGQHQLYRLSIASTRPSPTIGIAYPQQKVTPPKAPDPGRAPAAGNYRFHTPSVPEEEELSFGRCFPEAAAGRTSANYTSPPHGPKGQPPPGVPLKSPGTNGQLHYFEFQANGANAWPSPEKSFAGASYGVKPSSFSEGGKAGGHSLGTLPYQFPFQLLHEAGKEPYRGDAEYLDVAIATGQAAHGAFSFHSSSVRDWQEETPSVGPFEGACPSGRLYGVPPLLAPLPTPHRSPLPCYKGRSEHPTDPSGALSSSGAIDQNPSTFQENQAVFPSSLHTPSVPKPVGKGQASAKDSVPSPRLLLQSSPLRRNVPPNLSQVHFQSKAYCSPPAGSTGSVPFETGIPPPAPTHPRLVQAWGGAAKVFSPMDQNSAPYSNPVGSQFSFECQPGPEQRQQRQKNARMPWQQIHLAPAVPTPNRMELPRPIPGQKLPFPLATPEWPGSGKAHKGPPLSSPSGYHSKKLLSGDSLGTQHGDPASVGAFSFDSGKDPGSPSCDLRSKALFYGMNQAGPPPAPPASRSSSGSALVLPPSALVATSPCESPLPSPAPNPTCGSTCSSLSPMSSSPLNPGFDDGQMPTALAPSPFFHHPCHPKEGSKSFHPSEVLSSASLHYHPQDPAKPFHYPPDTLKDDNLLKCSPESPFHKPGVEVAKSCLEELDGGTPPPPPYTSHHLLAGSLSSASLDQLDVLLTCKQCDQNYSNLASFLEHRQFCTSHPEAKEGRRAPEPPKPPASMPLSPDPQTHLLALNKGEEFLLDGESKSEGKEDALKGGLFNASSLPLTASDLDIDDAKLDSLITEALNGLGYQSDNPEIDSSFIDVFVDEDLTAVKAAGSVSSHRVKEGLASESKMKHVATEEKGVGQPKDGYCSADGQWGKEQAKRRAGRQHTHKRRPARRLAARETEQTEPVVEEKTARPRAGRKNNIPPASSRPASSQKQPKKLNQEPQGASSKSPKPPRFSMKEMKKRKARSGTWSKELIHKIVQQKNKLHQLHTKSSKLPTVAGRPAPGTQEGRFQEYEYISDSEEEGAACSKLRGRRKRGAAFMGRAKYGFSKKCPARGERAKEKDPAWSYSQRRSRRKREAPEHSRLSSPETVKKGDGSGRACRRSSQSSMGSSRSTSACTKAGPSEPESKKAGMKGTRCSGSLALTPPAVLSHPEDRSPKTSPKSKEDFSRGSRRVGSAKPLVAASRTHLSTKADAVTAGDAEEEPLPQTQERQLPSTATLGRSPIRLSHKEEAEEPEGAANPTGEAREPTFEAQGSPGSEVVIQRQHFAPYTGDALKRHAEELMSPAHGGDGSSPSATYSAGEAPGLSDSGKGYAVQAAPVSDNAVGMMLAKAPDPYVSSDNAFFDPKGLPAHYDANLFSKPPPLGPSHMEGMYLCQEDISAGSFEQKHASVSPYTTETQQTKASSPLSFDSSSIFGELPVAEFDSPLYETVPASKDSYVTAFACPGGDPSKPLPFEQPFSAFMPEKDWSLMEEVAPMLPEDMAPFHGLSVDKPLAKKFPEEGHIPASQLPLPDRITDYNVAFMNHISDDELEIKRLVTELESQLQTSKLSSEVPTTPQKGEHHAAAALRGPADHFPSLPEEPGMGHQRGLFVADDVGSSNLMATGERLGGEKPAVARGDYEGGREPWRRPAGFVSLDAGMCTPAPADGFCPIKSGEGSDPRKKENESSSKSPPESCTPDANEVPVYPADPIAKSPPAATSTTFPKTQEVTKAGKDSLPPLAHTHDAESFPTPGKTGELSAELEKFDASLPSHNLEQGLQADPGTAADLVFSPHIKDVPDAEERPFGKSEAPKMVKSAVDFSGDSSASALLEEEEERKSPAAFLAPGHGDRGSKHTARLLDMLSLPNQSSPKTPQDTNPLQQLQLFVARTVKSNEEEMLLPCFPVLLAPGHPTAPSKGQPEQKEESNDGENQTYCSAPGEEDGPVVGNAESIAAPAKDAALFPSAREQLESFSAVGSYSEKLSTFADPELQNNVADLQHLANEHTELNDINIRADGASPEHNDLSPLKSTAVTLLPGQGKKADQLMEDQELDKNKATLAFTKHEQSHLSHNVPENETQGTTAAEMLGTNETECGVWCEGADVQVSGSVQSKHVGAGSAPNSPTDTLGPSGELQVHSTLPQDSKTFTVNAKLPRDGNSKKKPLSCHYADEALANQPLLMNSSHPEYLQSSGTDGEGSPSIGSQILEEKNAWGMEGPSEPRSAPCSPSQGVGKEGPESAGDVLPGSSSKQNQVCAIPDMVISSIPPKTTNYPTQPTADLLLITDKEVDLNQEKKFENCSSDGSKHQNDPEAVSTCFVALQVPTAVCRGFKRTGDLGPTVLNDHHSDTAEVETGDLSKITENGEKSLKGENPKSHKAEHGREAASCSLNNADQGENNTCPSTPKPSQHEPHKEKNPGVLQVICDICSASFRSKPGLTRHKAVKHHVRNSSVLQANKTPRSALISADRTSKAAAQKVPRKSLKMVTEKTCNSQTPTEVVEHVPKKICTGLEKEAGAQMQEVVSRVLSDLSARSLEMSQELHHTRFLHREMEAKEQCMEARAAGEVSAEKLDLGRQGRKGEKGRRSQSKDLEGINGNSEKKLNRKVRRRKAKAFASRHKPDGLCELEENSGPPPALLSSSLPNVMEGLHEPGGCISTEEQNRPNSSQHPQNTKQSPCAAELAEDPGDGTVSSKEMASREPTTGTAACPEEMEDPGQVESSMQACNMWVSGLAKQVGEGLGKVGKEQHHNANSREKMDTETRDGFGGSGNRNWSSAPQSPPSPSHGVPLLETYDLEGSQMSPRHNALQPMPAASPTSAEPKHWAKAELPPSREHSLDEDSTFSQLFPRDDQFIRRKCTRVYGKRSKKPKPSSEANLQPAGAIDLFTIQVASNLSNTSSFCVTREDPCEYETISIDDALTLNMCHGNKAKNGDDVPSESKSVLLRSDGEKIDQEKEVIDLEDNMLNFLCENSQIDNDRSMNIWGSLEKEDESLSAEMFEAPMGLESEHSLGEMSSEPPNLVEEPYNGRVTEDSGSPEFHTIDIGRLNAKFKMRDVCFFGPCEDPSGDSSTMSFKPKPGQHSKHSRSKLEDGKLSKNRGDITIKTKDKQYKCKVCFQWFLTLGELDFHKLTHNPSPPPTCYMCVQRKFSSREQLRDHLKEKHAKNKAGLWACGMCLKEISDVWMYNEHLREHATQFARKGQAQKSVMGLPSCFSEDSDAVTHFLNTIMCRKPSRSSRHADSSCKHGVSRESRSPRELPLEQEAKAMKEPLESSIKVKPAAPSSSKASASPSPERTSKSEGTPKSVPMHPDCKDPSRDCHHCGKQFPKPFKLQRHLVVHSLQKIYLCHKCPMFYQETKELRNHLSQEHGIVEEQEIKHTTLYACELCADVMHVIKKSFICSMCNYTFSKKEQYDRHMEKHLVGSSKTFKFRGVMRPSSVSRERREKGREDISLREAVPPSKRRKVAHHSSSPAHLNHTGDLQLVESPAGPNLQPPPASFSTASRDPTVPLPQTSVKTEELVGDFSDLLAEMEKSQFDTLPPPPCLSPSLPQAATSGPELSHIAALSIEELEKGAFDGKPLPFLDSPEFGIDLAGLACSQATDQKLSPPHLTEKCGYTDTPKRTSIGNKDEYIAGLLENPDAATDAMDGIPFLQLAKKVSEIPSPRAEAPPAKETHRMLWGNLSEASSWEGAPKATSPGSAHHPLPLKDKTASPALNRAAKDSAPQKKTAGEEAAAEEGQQGGVVKDKPAPEASTKDISTTPKDHGGNPGRSTGHQARGEAANNTAKLHPKRRKEHKSLSHRGSAGSRENMEGDGKKKKMRTPGLSRSEGSGELKRNDWSNGEGPALSPGRRDTHCNKLLPRPRAGSQPKKTVPDACSQKKGEVRHANGDVRRRKAILGKSLQQVLAKGAVQTPRGSLHGPRPARGTRPAGPASFRTAESQNNLLSQLFGQKLTSFKIPLRRDTSE